MNGPNIQQVVDVLAPLLEASEGTAPVAQDAEPDSQIDATASVATSAARG
jgi:hypothetical protein